MNKTVREIDVNTLRRDFLQMFRDHYSEVDRSCGAPLNIDWLNILKLYERRELFIIGAYVDGEPAGYMTYLKYAPLHHKTTLFASTDAFYVLPKYRGNGVFRTILHVAESMMADQGVSVFQIISPGENNTEVIHKRRIS
jgi:GNAT superfamily N-acetyltransferase